MVNYSHPSGEKLIPDISTGDSARMRQLPEPGLCSDDIFVEDHTLPDFNQEMQLGWTSLDNFSSGNPTTLKTFGIPGPETLRHVSAERDPSFNPVVESTTSRSP